MKLERRAKIIELIGRYEIETQEELAERLQQAGYSVTQATISRDIRELKLTKVSVGDGPRQKYTLLQEEANLYQKYVRVLQDGLISLEQADIRTRQAGTDITLGRPGTHRDGNGNSRGMSALQVRTARNARWSHRF